MKFMHFLVLMFFVSILLYLGLKNSGGVAQIFTSGGPQVVNLTKTLQGR
jgi:hypothetical protein